MALRKPPAIASDRYKSEKWDELTAGRDFGESDAPTLSLLCSWYQVIDKCMSDISTGDGVEVAYVNKLGDEKARPQLSTMKQASAEIRQLNKQLGISDQHEEPTEAKVTPLAVIRGKYKGSAGTDCLRGAGA